MLNGLNKLFACFTVLYTLVGIGRQVKRESEVGIGNVACKLKRRISLLYESIAYL